jgi:hypothetical protein
MAAELCVGCGEETGIGSVFYSDRRAVEHSDGSTSFLCTLCDQRLAATRGGRKTRLTDEEIRRGIETGSLAMISGAWQGGVGPPGF